MASGYIHITRKDLIFDEDNGVVYWKNGARFLGEIAKAVLNPGEETETVKYYLKSAVTKKAILIDAGVIVGGGLFYFVTDDANFINVRIETADFSSDGGGDGVAVTFLLPESKYYTVRYVEENGDIKLFDVDGDAGTLVPDALPDVTDASAGDALVLDEDKKPTWDAIPDELPDTAAASVGDALVLDADKKPIWAAGGKKYYNHSVRLYSSNDISFYLNIITDSPTSFTRDTLQQYIIDHGRRPCTGMIKDPGSPTVYAIVVSLNEVSAVGELGYFRFGTAKFDFTNGAFAYEQLSRRNLSVSDTITEI